jgi:hypothetical protein
MIARSVDALRLASQARHQSVPQNGSEAKTLFQLNGIGSLLIGAGFSRESPQEER